MSGVNPQHPRAQVAGVAGGAPASQIPGEFSDAYELAYRRSLAEHPTELMLRARPGKRAAERSGLRSRVIAALAEIMLRPRARVLLATGGAALLILLSFVAGRLAS